MHQSNPSHHAVFRDWKFCHQFFPVPVPKLRRVKPYDAHTHTHTHTYTYTNSIGWLMMCGWATGFPVVINEIKEEDVLTTN